MLHFLLRLLVWVVVLGGGYLLLGPELFDTSSGGGPFESDSEIFLPPAKSPRLLQYDTLSQEGTLSPEERAEYQRLTKDRASRFWQQEGVSVQEALAGVKSRRKDRLVEILRERGASREEITVFLFVVERDNPALLADRE